MPFSPRIHIIHLLHSCYLALELNVQQELANLPMFPWFRKIALLRYNSLLLLSHLKYTNQ